ncbi:hypothetical protein CHS0354_031965 [Potamilus streckersoni]|uniref:Aminopeptidase N-like N-terminal domain-containing protein n=1 Tax=Potamilus streckersoni TaxID=2493646 RepID=A0AAE0TL86_9BIVA|nr:hypothetical protein CHS0354_031965 [Potamilus streckersoni]
MESMNVKDFKGKKQSASRRRVLCIVISLLAVFIVAIILVGVLVWKFSKCGDNVTPLSENFRGNMTFGTTTEIPRTTTDLHGDGPWKNLRLSRSVVPIHYDVTLYPDFYENNGWFYGNETILLNVTEITKYILIHVNYLNITKTHLRYNSTGTSIPIEEPFEYEQNQFWVVQTKTPIPKGTVIILDLQFDGSLTRAIVGFYKSTYINHDTNETRYLATSKFEPVAARRAFPCFDEPNMKAEFTVTLVHRHSYIALSNMPVERVYVHGRLYLGGTRVE